MQTAIALYRRRPPRRSLYPYNTCPQHNLDATVAQSVQDGRGKIAIKIAEYALGAI